MLKSNILTLEKISSLLEHLKNISDDNNIYWTEFPANKSGEYQLPFCYQLSVTLQGKRYDSWGASYDRDLAIFKSFAELIERIIFSFSYPLLYERKSIFIRRSLFVQEIEQLYPNAKNWLGQTSSGVAIHTNKKDAMVNACSELIERHTILKAIALKIPCARTYLPKYLEKKYHIPKAISLDFFYWIGPLYYNVVICRISVNNGFIFAFGSSKNLSKAIEKSFLEATGMIVYANQIKGKLPTKFCNTDKIDLKSIAAFHLWKRDEEIESLLNNVEKVPQEIDTHINSNDIYYGKYFIPDFLGDTRPLVCYRALSPKLQPLFVDYWKSEYINPAAISIDLDKMPKSLHIIH